MIPLNYHGSHEFLTFNFLLHETKKTCLSHGNRIIYYLLSNGFITNTPFNSIGMPFIPLLVSLTSFHRGKYSLCFLQKPTMSFWICSKISIFQRRYINPQSLVLIYRCFQRLCPIASKTIKPYLALSNTRHLQSQACMLGKF